MKRGLPVLLAMLAVAGCASREPIVMQPRFTPAGGFYWLSKTSKAEHACRITLAAVQDARPDKQSMGTLGGRVVRASDSVAWLRAGFETLDDDARIVLAGGGDTQAPGLSLRVDLIKAHVASVNMAKTANVVVRVTFTSETAEVSERILRGEANDVNWGSGDGEALDLMNIALAEVVAAAHADVLARCASASTTAV